MKRAASIFTLACVLLSGLQFATIDTAEARGAIPVRAKPMAQVRIQPRNPVAQNVRTGNSTGIGKVAGTTPDDGKPFDGSNKGIIVIGGKPALFPPEPINPQ